MVYSNLESLRTSFYASNLRVILFDSVNGEIVRVGWEGSELSCFVDVGQFFFTSQEIPGYLLFIRNLTVSLV